MMPFNRIIRVKASFGNICQNRLNRIGKCHYRVYRNDLSVSAIGDDFRYIAYICRYHRPEASRR